MVELADTSDLGSDACSVQVRVLLPALRRQSFDWLSFLKLLFSMK